LNRGIYKCLLLGAGTFFLLIIWDGGDKIAALMDRFAEVMDKSTELMDKLT